MNADLIASGLSPLRPGWAAIAALSVVAVSCGHPVRSAELPTAASATRQDQIAPYLTPQQMVHIEEGRSINLVCLGQGSPTVILTAGLQNWSFHWWLVQRPLAERTRVCAWDRAGYGFSSPSAEPQDTVHTTKDLERALRSAGIRGPYVMVGHSLGAYETLRFADLHRKSVVGMVLVDPAIPDQQALMERLAPLFKAKSRAIDGQFVQQLRQCAVELRGGSLSRSDPKFERCTDASAVPGVFPRLQAAIARLNADPARLMTQASTVEEFDSDAAHDSREAVNTRRHYGNMPLIVLTAGRDEEAMSFLVRDAPPAEAAEFHRQLAQYLRNAWVPGHDVYAALSTRGRNQVVSDATHTIQIGKPEVVISAVFEVLDGIRASARHEP